MDSQLTADFKPNRSLLLLQVTTMHRRTLLASAAAITAVSGLPAFGRPRVAFRPSPHGFASFEIGVLASCAKPFLTLGHAFAPGAVPSGSRVVLLDHAGEPISVQQDQENFWPDRSLRFAVLSFVAPQAFRGRETLRFTLDAEPGDPVRSAALTTSALAAASDYILRVHGYDYGQDRYTVSVRDVLANFADWHGKAGWGLNPLGGWEPVRLGPICAEWRIWRMLKRESDGASHRWVKAVLYVRAWSDGAGGIAAIEILPSLRQSNSYGPHPKGMAGDKNVQRKHTGIAELWDGSRLIRSWGGPRDPLAVNVPPNAFDTKSNELTVAARHWHGASGVGVAVSGPGVPSGVPQNQVLWISWSGNVGPGLARERDGVLSSPDIGGLEAWAPNHTFGANWTVRVPAGGLWHTAAGGTTGNTPPSGSHAVKDGSVTWEPALYKFGHPGRGHALIVPLVTTFPGSNAILSGNDGDPIWHSATREAAKPLYQAAHDPRYLTRDARLLPTYDLSLGILPASGSSGPYMVNSPSISSDATGDAPGDERIGYLSQSQARLLLCPHDPITESTTKFLALSFADFPGTWDDERTGRPVSVSTRSYPGLIPNPGFSLGDWNGYCGLPCWHGLGPSPNMYQGRYRPLMDGSHLPALWIMPLLRTGHTVFAEIGLNEAITMLASMAPAFRDPKIGGRTYENCVLALGPQQVRGMGWALRALGMIGAMMPVRDPLHPFIRDTLDDTAAFGAAWPGTVRPELRRLGCLWESLDAPFMSPFFYNMLAVCVAVEVRRGDRDGWSALLRSMAPTTIGLWDEAQGGSSYYIDAYHLNWKSGGKGWDAAYPSVAAMIRANFPKAPPQPTRLFEDAGGGLPMNDAALIAHTVYQGERGFPWNVTGTGTLVNAALAAQASAKMPRAPAVYAALQYRLHTYPLKGIAFVGQDRRTAYPTWAIVSD